MKCGRGGGGAGGGAGGGYAVFFQKRKRAIKIKKTKVFFYQDARLIRKLETHTAVGFLTSRFSIFCLYGSYVSFLF